MYRKRKFIGHAWRTSLEVVSLKKRKYIFRIYYFIDILVFGFRYNATTFKYMDLNYYDKNRDEIKQVKEELIALRDYKKRVAREEIIMSKYGSIKYEDPRKRHIRHKKYMETFNLGKGSIVQYHVWIRCAHGAVSSKFICGGKVALQRNVDIDYTGGLEIGNGVSITEGVKILTHKHDSFGLKGDLETPRAKRVYLTKLVIEDNVAIGVRAIIMPGVERIGENAFISAGSVVRKKVPPNAIVAGDPAQVVTVFPPEKRVRRRWDGEE